MSNGLATLQVWTDSLNPMIAFLVMSATFLVMSTAGWYTGDLISWLRR